MGASVPSGGGAWPYGVLFVCMGNICRSPMARWLAIDLARERGIGERLHFDSCGTGGWHAGEGADARSVAVAAKYGLNTEHTARQLAPETDFARFNLIIPMDRENRRAILEHGAARERVRLMRSFDPTLQGEHDVPDPYHGGVAGFEAIYQMLHRATSGLLDSIEKALSLRARE